MKHSADEPDFVLSESEQRWLSHELHDGLMQWIVGAKMHGEALLDDSRRGDSPSTEQLAYLVRLLTTAATEGRRLIAGLRPLELDHSNWQEATRVWLQLATTDDSAKITLDFADRSRELPDDVQRCAYRIAQEAIGNARRHANAANIRVQAIIESGKLQLRVEDDGCGFDTSCVDSDRYGLKGMRECAEMLGGSATITASPGAGTRVDVCLPLDTHHRT